MTYTGGGLTPIRDLGTKRRGGQILKCGTACPREALRTVITTNEAKAAENTTALGCRIAMSAAIRNVLSPNSEIIIMVKENRKACNGVETRPVEDLVSDPSKSNIECNGERRPSESESACNK